MILTIMNFFGKKFKTILLLILFFELLSLLGHFVPVFSTIGFLVAIIALIVLSIKDLSLGLCFLFVELFIGSFGRLFSIEIGEFSLSVRMGIWVTLMILWILRSLIILAKTKRCPSLQVIKSKKFKIFVPLFIFIMWGVVNAFLNQNELSNIFRDANAWLYFSIVFPVFSTIRFKHLDLIIQVFLASVLWISAKTFLLLFVFSHNMFFSMSELYTWVRDTRIGEITSMENGFSRIFFQSHIFVLVATFILFLIVSNLILKNKDIFTVATKRRKLILFSSLLSLFLAVDLLNQSRSNWVGLVIGLSLCLFLIVYKNGLKKIFVPLAVLFYITVLSFVLIVVTVKFPYPDPSAGFNTATMLTSRSVKIKNEAGASSRFALLPKLWSEIKTAPILGKGFGSTVTYKSSDPRVLENNSDGLYTTFAFEWGWLDIWLKLGLVGALSYLFLLLYIIIDTTRSLEKFNILQIGFLIGLITMSCVSFFSPYMNHPLGIGYLVLLVAILYGNKSTEESLTK